MFERAPALVALIVTLSIGSVAWAGDGAPDVEGTWVVQSAVMRGQPSEEPVGDKMVFAGDKLTVFVKGQERPAVRFSIDASKTPQHIDLVHEMGGESLVIKGLIEVKGDKARLCMGLPGSPRPASFESPSDSTHMVLSLERQVQEPKPVRLFNGKDLTGWTHFLWDGKSGGQDTETPVEKVWQVQDGVLVCQGRPTGYLQTEAEYENYKLELEWRWPEGTTRANSGVLLHVTTPNALGPWPKSIESQLYTNNAGDFWAIGTTLKVANEAERKKGRRHLNLTDDSEKPIGQWNRMEIVCRGREIAVRVNGVLVNHATECSDVKGRIALQSEGLPIHFRNIVLTPWKENDGK